MFYIFILTSAACSKHGPFKVMKTSKKMRDGRGTSYFIFLNVILGIVINGSM